MLRHVPASVVVRPQGRHDETTSKPGGSTCKAIPVVQSVAKLRIKGPGHADRERIIENLQAKEIDKMEPGSVEIDRHTTVLTNDGRIEVESNKIVE
jgi:hypothetical protein